MDNEKKLVQELLKLDGIDPAVISDTERAAFREMLDSEQKRIKRISWCITGMMWIFAIAMLGLCFSQRLLNALHIPLAAAGIIAAVAVYAAIIPLVMRLYNKLTAGKKKAIHLEKLVHGNRQSSGLVLVGIKNGRRFIHWPNVFIITVALWLVMLMTGAFVYYLICSRWIFLTNPFLYPSFCAVASIAFILTVIYQALKLPMEALAEVKPDQYLRSKKILKLISASIIIIAFMLSISILDKTVAPAYAIDQTIEANKGMRYLHVRNISPPAPEPQDIWIEFNDNGEIKAFHLEEGLDKSFRIMVFADDMICWYSPPKNEFVILSKDLNAHNEFKRMSRDFDPKFAVEFLQKLQLEGKMEIEIEPSGDNGEPIKLTAIAKAPIKDRVSPKQILLIDPVTKLAIRRDTYEMKDDKYILWSSFEFLEYNKPIDPQMFILEPPKDVNVEDRTRKD